MFKVIFLTALVSINLPAFAEDVQNLSWMTGCWRGEDRGVQMEECWSKPEGGALLGTHRDIVNGKMVSWEFMRIDGSQQDIVYYASPKSRTPTPFTLLTTSTNKVIFENKEHNFPQRIIYWLDAEGKLNARIEGKKGEKEVSMQWTWKRSQQ